MMHHDVFGEIAYNDHDLAWTGLCALPAFAEYGRLAPDDHSLLEPAPEFERGQFALTIQDQRGNGPSTVQVNVFRYLQENEKQVCSAVLREVVEACDMRGGLRAWLQKRRNSRLWGWLARLVGPEYKTPEDLKQAVRCTGVEISKEYVGAYAYIGFYFQTVFAFETEHGLSVIFHPETGTFAGDASAIFDV